ncbi:MAG: LuxR C-terminal-related transcriptional regulator [Acidimicrobiales bacterium]
MSNQPERAAASMLADRLANRLRAPAGTGEPGVGAGAGAEGPMVVAITGSMGSGRSGVLAAARAAVQRSGASFRLIDDAHQMDPTSLAALARALAGGPNTGDAPRVLLVSWVEPLLSEEVAASLGVLAQRAGRADLLVSLGPLSEDELAGGVAATLGALPDRILLEWLAAQTDGRPWLVQATLAALVQSGVVTRGRFNGHPPTLEGPELTPARQRVSAELAALPAAHRPVLAALIAGGDPQSVAEIAVAAGTGWSALQAAGLAGPEGLAPLVFATALASLSPAELAGGHQAAGTLLTRRGFSTVVRAEHAWAGRAAHEEAAQSFLEAGFEVLAADPRAAAEWFDRAACTAAVRSPLALAGRGAQAEALVLQGEVAAGFELADYVLGRDEDEPHATAAVALASSRRSRWMDVAQWSARVVGHHGVSDLWWRWQTLAALLVAGQRGQFEALLNELDQTAPTTPVVSQLREAVLITRAGLGSDRAQLLEARRAVRSLIGAQSLLRSPTVAALGPAELVAVTSLALGEPEGARLALHGQSRSAGPLVERVEPDGGGPTGSTAGRPGPRRRALTRWSLLRCGDIVRLSGAGAEASAPTGSAGSGGAAVPGVSAGGPDDMDDLDAVALAVRAAMARRNGDVAASAAVARQLTQLLAALDVDLLNLDAATELLVLARRFAPPMVADAFDEAIDAFLAGLGSPPAWSARWHWARLEAAIAAGAGAVRPASAAAPGRLGITPAEEEALLGVAPTGADPPPDGVAAAASDGGVSAVDGPGAALHDAVAALQQIAAVLPGVSVLADAASVWSEVLTGVPDAARIDGAVRNLQVAGFVWEAAQLAGQAAIRVDDATLAKSLLGQARSLRGGGQAPNPGPSPAPSTGRDDGAVTPAGLSEREVEVARLVLNGLTHKAIGATLYISPKTVEHHVAHIRQKLGATNRAEFLAALREDLATAV